jgi:hypothetical protein
MEAGFEFNRLRFPVARDGDRVHGRVQFPYAVASRDQIPIDYRRFDQSRTREEADTDSRAAERLAILDRFNELRARCPKMTKSDCARSVGVAIRTIDSWRKRLAAYGPAGLSDNYTAAPPRVLTCTAGDAQNACIICAWWAFRIGNLDRIDHKSMHSALALFVPSCLRASVPSSRWLAAILATIDCYYRAKIDRARFPFKRFAKWCTYPEGFQRWLYIACDEEEWRQRCAEQSRDREEAVPIVRSPIHVSSLPSPPKIADVRERRRQTLNRPTRQALASLTALRPSVPPSLPHRPSVPPSLLLALPDSYRLLLIRAATRSRGWLDAANQAQATMPVWWPDLPQDVQQSIDEEVAAALASDSSLGRTASEAELNRLRWPLVMVRLTRELTIVDNSPNPAAQIASCSL